MYRGFPCCRAPLVDRVVGVSSVLITTPSFTEQIIRSRRRRMCRWSAPRERSARESVRQPRPGSETRSGQGGSGGCGPVNFKNYDVKASWIKSHPLEFNCSSKPKARLAQRLLFNRKLSNLGLLVSRSISGTKAFMIRMKRPPLRWGRAPSGKHDQDPDGDAEDNLALCRDRAGYPVGGHEESAQQQTAGKYMVERDPGSDILQGLPQKMAISSAVPIMETGSASESVFVEQVGSSDYQGQGGSFAEGAAGRSDQQPGRLN